MDSINGKVLTESYRAGLVSDLGESGVDGRIILSWIFRKWDWGGDVDWIELAQNRNSWRAFMFAVMNLVIP